ncbi:MAG: DUF255 domain-containing protein [Lewinellaceae bacterium]|nr:DUF255 domain-containing protein [Lewinellaceae bacterium]
MAKKLLIGAILAAIAAIACSFTICRPAPAKAYNLSGESITWHTWEEAQELMAKEPKKMFIDVYTDWCGWCKRMDKETFTDSGVAKYMNEHFYAVKFNAEQKEDIVYRGTTLSYRPSSRRGVHDLAVSLLDGRMGYPSFVYLDENQDRISISPGYKTPDMMVKELKYIGGDFYKNTSFEQFQGR